MVKVLHLAVAEQVYAQWRCRPRIAHTYRFEQEQDWTSKPCASKPWNACAAFFVLVLLAALFVYHIARTCPHQAILWLRRLGGKLGLNTDAGGPYILLAGISAVLIAVATLGYAQHHTFLRPRETYG
jgi:hypothetical protein